MQRLETSIPGVYEIRPAAVEGARGFFIGSYERQKFRSLGIGGCFVEDNHSRSTKGTLRGLHYQLRHPQVPRELLPRLDAK
ncbi:MAG TPA: dTDP-4-dehydrorhamnose 3,5-epimerase family protein [Candidatus Cybelea sp.]|nr:dTDP-4-dehydrorhamnose 3,5-epimerase family protein [Candidatus Cybelea sp.]